jgi:hypothetical protein
MMQHDVFNGDADGLCALLQLRFAQPAETLLITGVKRDIELLAKVNVQKGDHVTVLDISLAKNCTELNRVLEQGASVFYIDHHQSGVIPQHNHLKTMIYSDPNICTSLLIDHYLIGQCREWAVVGAFGDNLVSQAEKAARPLSLTAKELKTLQNLGIYINYNSYGDTIADLHFAPDALYRECTPYDSPLDFIADKPVIYEQLRAAYNDDITEALKISPEYQSNFVAVYLLPDTAWARRVSGVLSNELANRYPDRAHAVLSYRALGDYQVSVRAPLSKPTGADELCANFETGGGRQSAAGINQLPFEQVPVFINALEKHYR